MRSSPITLAVGLVVAASCSTSPVVTETTVTTPQPATSTPPVSRSPVSTSTTAPAGDSTTAFPYDFARHGDTPVLAPGSWATGYSATPWVTRHGDEWLMFHAGRNRETGDTGVGLARSIDGLTWERVGDAPVYTRDGAVPSWASTIEIDSVWHMYYTTGWTAGYLDVYLATAPAPEGPWTGEQVVIEAPRLDWNRRILIAGVTEIDGVYLMPFAGFDIDARHPAIGILSSSDGIVWEVTPEPIYRGSGGEWDSHGVVPSNIVRTEHGLEIFFLGFDRPPAVEIVESSPTLRLGRLVSTDGGATWQADNHGGPVVDTGEKGWPGVSTVYVDGEYRLYEGDDLGAAGVALITGTIPGG